MGGERAQRFDRDNRSARRPALDRTQPSLDRGGWRAPTACLRDPPPQRRLWQPNPRNRLGRRCRASAGIFLGSQAMRFVRTGLCALVVFAVLAHGAVEDWAKAVVETGAGLLLLVWAAVFYLHREEDQEVVLTPLLPPLLLLAIVALAQLLLPITASRYDTRMDLDLLAAYAIVLFL